MGLSIRPEPSATSSCDSRRGEERLCCPEGGWGEWEVSVGFLE